MTQQTYTPADIVQFAMNKDGVNISAAFDQMIGQRVADAVQARKVEVAKAMYGQQEVDQAAAELEDETEVEDDETQATDEVEDENNKESEESHEDAEQSA
jgi:hypothetical protein